MSRIVRGQLALDTADRLKETGAKLLRLHEYSGDALASQLKSIDVSIAAALQGFETIIRSCRSAKNSYPNYPALRAALGDAGDVVYELADNVKECRSLLNSPEGPGSIKYVGENLIALAQRLRLVSFVPPESNRQQQA